MTALRIALALFPFALLACASRNGPIPVDTQSPVLDSGPASDAIGMHDGDGNGVGDAFDNGDGDGGGDGQLPPGGLVEVTGFGSNPGNLRMYTYVPEEMPAKAPLVVVLHGCSQSSLDFAQTSGWNQLADEKKLYLVYAEQSTANNLTVCFNWFAPGDNSRDKGEALSIRQMVERMKADHNIDPARIFVTGLSAGGAMAAALMAVYPDLFAGGAIMAGVPYGCASDVASGISCLKGVDKLPLQWGTLVRQALPEYTGAYPRVTIFHGEADTVIDDSNMFELVDQWTYVHAIDQIPEISDTVHGHQHQVFEAINGTPMVETFHLKSMGHGIAVDPGTLPGQGGQTGYFAHDVNLWSSNEAAKFWGL